MFKLPFHALGETSLKMLKIIREFVSWSGKVMELFPHFWWEP